MGGQHMTIQATFSLDDTTITTETKSGVTHQTIQGTITNEQGVASDQVIHVLSGNPTTNSNLHVVAGDSYPVLSYGTVNLPGIQQHTDGLYDSLDLIGGVNADYFNMVKGIPVEAYIRNYEVVSSGLGYNRPVIGFKDSGEVVFGRPCFEGMELVIQNANGDIKHRVPIERINKLPYSNLGTTVYFNDYDLTIESAFPKLRFETTDFKTDGYKTRYFGKGEYLTQTTDEITVATNEFVVVSNDPYIKELISSGDRVIAQEKVACGFEDVRFAVGAWEHLVNDGVAINHMDTGTAPGYANPRTAIGVKADGTVVMVTIDGRQSALGMDGMTLYEVADLLVSLGVVEAYGLDGGGSTTMTLINQQGTPEIVNSPSDASPRRLSNGIFFAIGTLPALPTVLDLPELGEDLPVPTGIHIDIDGVLRFDKVDHATNYEVLINGESYISLSRDLPLNVPAGSYEISIRSLGDGTYFYDSPFSSTIFYVVYPESIEDILELFRNYARSESK